MAVTIASGFPKSAMARASQAVSPSYAVASGQALFALVAGGILATGPDPVLSEVTITGGTIAWTKLLRFSAASPKEQTVTLYRGIPTAAVTGVTTKAYTGTFASFISIVVCDAASGNVGGSASAYIGGLNCSVAVPAVAAGSLILGLGFNNTGSPTTGNTPIAANTELADLNDGVDCQAFVARVTATTGGAGSVTVGETLGASNSSSILGFEILGSVGSGVATLIGISGTSAVGKGFHKSSTAGPTLAGLGAASATSFRTVTIGGQITRPDMAGIQDPRWGESLTGVRGGVQVTPPSGRLDIGWINGDQPPEGFMNWWQYGVWKWIQWIKSIGNPIVQIGHFSAPVPTAIGRYSLWPANSEAVPSVVAAGQTGPKRGIVIPRAAYVDTLLVYIDPATPISGAGSVDIEVWMVDGSARKIGTWTYSVASGITSGLGKKIQKLISDGTGVAQSLGAYLVVEANVTGILPQVSNVKVLVRVCGQDTVPVQ